MNIYTSPNTSNIRIKFIEIQTYHIFTHSHRQAQYFNGKIEKSSKIKTIKSQNRQKKKTFASLKTIDKLNTTKKNLGGFK